MPTEQSLRVVFLAVDDEFAGEMQQFVYRSHPDWIAGVVIASRPIYKRSRIGGLLFVLRKSGLVFLREMVNMKLVRALLDKKSRVFPSQLARDHNVERFLSSDINDELSVATLRRWRPDLIISTNFSHYIGKAVRDSIARYGCWNLHKSLLPHYRGMAPSFHALLEGAQEVGATLHVVAKELDGGDVLAQVKVPVSKIDTVYSLNRKTARAGGKMLDSFLKDYDPTSVKPAAQPAGASTNYTYPTREEIRAFRKKGLKFYDSAGQ